jgi:hypothetical protein
MDIVLFYHIATCNFDRAIQGVITRYLMISFFITCIFFVTDITCFVSCVFV